MDDDQNGCMECPVCMEERVLSTFKPCNHSFCSACSHKFIRKSFACPLCRQSFSGVEPPLCETSEIAQSVQHLKRIKIDLGNGKHAGITVSDSCYGDGVCVVKTQKKDECYRKLKTSDVILSINGLPAQNHAEACKAIDAATLSGQSIEFLVREPISTIDYMKMVWRKMKQKNEEVSSSS